MAINSIETAYAAGRQAAKNGMPVHDLMSEIKKREIPAQFTGAWISGVEDALGHDPDEEAEQRAFR